eukprot:XP_001700157.1 mitochondrial inner membrane peptidase [Chlamydomonas reinhardtii]
MMVFTCTKCDTRSTKAFSKQSYQNGVVLVRCPGCQKLHLVADHLGWFGEEPFVLHEHVAQLAAVAAAVSSDGGLFELSDESQVRAALAEARELKGQQRQRQQPRDESKGKQ